jgi:hypothetical protein
METNKERTNRIREQISHLYRSNVHVEEAIESMRDQSISSRSVKSFYNHFSRNAEKLTTERFHYYTTGVNKDLYEYTVICWTSRYLLAYCKNSPDSDYYEIQIIDVFNDKSM